MIGGVGITPIMSYINDLYRSNIPRSAHCVTRVTLLWVIPNDQLYQAFATTLRDAAQPKAIENTSPPFNLHVYSTREVSTIAGIKNDRPSIMGVVGEALEGAASTYLFVCGPTSLINNTWDVVTSAKHQTHANIRFHHEIFDF